MLIYSLVLALSSCIITALFCVHSPPSHFVAILAQVVVPCQVENHEQIFCARESTELQILWANILRMPARCGNVEVHYFFIEFHGFFIDFH